MYIKILLYLCSRNTFKPTGRWDITANCIIMKKLFLGVAFALISFTLMAQQPFVGTTILKTNMHYEENFDVMVENFKATVDKDTVMDAKTKGLAKSMAKAIVKNTLKQIELQKYITSLPEGEYTTLNYWDGPKNRIAAFTPEIGRIMIWDGNEGTLIVAYPNLKTALKVTDPGFKTNQFRVSANYRDADPNAQVTEINGFRAVPNFGVVPKATLPNDKSEVIVIDEIEYVKVPAPGLILENYNILVQQNVTTDYYTQEQNLIAFNKATVADANYQLPADYKVVSTADALVKSLQKAIKANKLAFPYDVTQTPEVIWSIFK